MKMKKSPVKREKTLVKDGKQVSPNYRDNREGKTPMGRKPKR
jgi:hypothetical protein